MSGSPKIPHIAVTTDLASTHSLHGSEEDGKSQHDSVLSNEQDRQTMSPVSDHFPPRSTSPLSGGLLPVHTRSPSDPAFLSPFSMSPTSTAAGRMSLDVPPRSPTPSYASSNEGSSYMAPPSPTLSTQSSVHFATSVALRDNKPGDGTTSLGLLPVKQHGRKASWASSGEGHSSIDDTEPDHGGLGHSSLHRVASAATSMTVASPTHTHVDNLSERSRSRSRSRAKKDSADSDGVTAVSDTTRHPSGEHRRSLDTGKGKAADIEEDPKNTRVDLEQDPEDVNPAPFEFKPYTLASMLDPKNLEALEALGGVKGLLKGLGTSRTRGLGRKALMRNGSFDTSDGDGRPGAGIGSSQRHDRQGEEEGEGGVPGIVVTSPDEEGDDGKDAEDEDESAYSASLDERRRVYGHNVLPHRATKSLLALMWLALKDKVLVRTCFPNFV